MNRWMKGTVPVLLAGGLFGLAGVSCSDADEAYDCANICEKYSDCIDDDLDELDCIDRCEDNADADSDFADMADDCEACIDDESCVDAAVECTDECAVVVAEST
jgi:hypothetical protein